MSAVTARPSARAVAITFSARAMSGQFSSPAALKVIDVHRQPASRPTRIASSIASTTRPLSFRMWVKYTPSCSAATVASSMNLFRRRIRAGRVDQSRREADRAISHGLGDERLHLGELLGGRLGVRVTDDDLPHLGGAYVVHDVEGDPMVTQTLEVLGRTSTR